MWTYLLAGRLSPICLTVPCLNCASNVPARSGRAGSSLYTRPTWTRCQPTWRTVCGCYELAAK